MLGKHQITSIGRNVKIQLNSKADKNQRAQQYKKALNPTESDSESCYDGA